MRYVLEGSVQRGGNRMRVNVQLDRRRKRQSSLGRSLRQAGGRSLRHAGRDRDASCRRARTPQLIAAEARRAERSPHPDVDGPLFSGNGLHPTRAMTPDYMAQAHGFFERALALDPANVEALVGVAHGRHDVRRARSSTRRPRSAPRGGGSGAEPGACLLRRTMPARTSDSGMRQDVYQPRGRRHRRMRARVASRPQPGQRRMSTIGSRQDFRRARRARPRRMSRRRCASARAITFAVICSPSSRATA